MAKKGYNNGTVTEKTTIVGDDRLQIGNSANAYQWRWVKKSTLSTQVQADIKAEDNTFTGANVFPTMNVGSVNTVSGDNAFALGNSNVASGDKSHAEGFYSEAIGNQSHASGFGSKARYSAQFAHANTPFISAGDAQYTRNIQTKQTEDGVEIECILNSSQRYVLVENFICACAISIIGSNSDGSVAGSYKRQALIKNISGTTALIGTVQTIGTDIETGSIGGISITADNTNNSLCIKVTGKTATSINWFVENSALEVGY